MLEVEPVCKHFLPKDFRPWQNRFATLNLFNLSLRLIFSSFWWKYLALLDLPRWDFHGPHVCTFTPPSFQQFFQWLLFTRAWCHNRSEETIGSPALLSLLSQHWSNKRNEKNALTPQVRHRIFNSHSKSVGKGSKGRTDQIKSILSTFFHSNCCEMGRKWAHLVGIVNKASWRKSYYRGRILIMIHIGMICLLLSSIVVSRQ